MSLLRSGFKIISFCFLILFFLGCESNNAFRSEKRLNKLIQATWSVVPMSHEQPKEDWVFNNGFIYRVFYDSTNTQYNVDTGAYVVDAKLTNAFVMVTEFNLPFYEPLNGKWTIVELDKKIMVISANYADKRGVISREFVKK